MILSHNEILVTCRKVFEVWGFAQGELEDAADSVAWREQIGLSSINTLCELHEFAQKRDRVPLNYPANSYAVPRLTPMIDSLRTGPLIADYALVRASESGQIRLPFLDSQAGLWAGYLRHIAQRGFYVSLYWRSRDAQHRLMFAANEALPSYVQWNALTRDDTDWLEISREPIVVKRSDDVRSIDSAEFAANRQHCLYNGIKVNDDCWQILTEIAKGILVEATAESRQRGAGEQL